MYLHWKNIICGVTLTPWTDSYSYCFSLSWSMRVSLIQTTSSCHKKVLYSRSFTDRSNAFGCLYSRQQLCTLFENPKNGNFFCVVQKILSVITMNGLISKWSIELGKQVYQKLHRNWHKLSNFGGISENIEQSRYQSCLSLRFTFAWNKIQRMHHAISLTMQSPQYLIFFPSN